MVQRFRPTHGKITGYPLPNTEGMPGRPPEYVSDDAKMLHSRLTKIGKLLDKLALDPGFTYDSEMAMRSRIRALANHLNRNRDPEAKAIKAAKGKATRAAKKAAALAARQSETERRENPATAAHALLMIAPSGAWLTVCGFRPVSHRHDGVWYCDVIITECAELVDCPGCIAAGAQPR